MCICAHTYIRTNTNSNEFIRVRININRSVKRMRRIFCQEWRNELTAFIHAQPNQRLLISKVIPEVNPKSKQAAVFIPLCFRHSIPSILFTLRTDKVSSHRGEVSFPGGRNDENETAVEAAVRETYEELGDNIGDLKIIGACQTIPSRTGVSVTPIIGYIDKDVGDFEHFSPSEDEVAKVFTRSIEVINSPGFRTFESYERNGRKFTAPVFGDNTGDERIWGLTAIILNAVMDHAINTLPNK